MVIDAVNLLQYIGAFIRISASIHLPWIGDAERMGLKLHKRSYFEQAMLYVMCYDNNRRKYNVYSPERI
jgi:hypothetical protein